MSLLEAHKLMYFMQEAGEPLDLRYTKAIYGPCAENLRHVFHSVEGHLISGYRDGGDNPRKQIELVPGAIKDAEAFLSENPETRDRLERVAKLIEGFETPFGLELLATVHWVVTREDAAGPEDAVAKVYSWNKRKKRFGLRQIEVAFQYLQQEKWFDECG